MGVEADDRPADRVPAPRQAAPPRADRVLVRRRGPCRVIYAIDDDENWAVTVVTVAHRRDAVARSPQAPPRVSEAWRDPSARARAFTNSRWLRLRSGGRPVVSRTAAWHATPSRPPHRSPPIPRMCRSARSIRSCRQIHRAEFAGYLHRCRLPISGVCTRLQRERRDSRSWSAASPVAGPPRPARRARVSGLVEAHGPHAQGGESAGPGVSGDVVAGVADPVRMNCPRAGARSSTSRRTRFHSRGAVCRSSNRIGGSRSSRIDGATPAASAAMVKSLGVV